MSNFNLQKSSSFSSLRDHLGSPEVINKKTQCKLNVYFFETSNSNKPYNEVCQIPISQELDQYYPLDSSKVGFSIAGSASDDSLFLTVRTWPSRSAADISGMVSISIIKIYSHAGGQSLGRQKTVKSVCWKLYMRKDQTVVRFHP